MKKILLLIIAISMSNMLFAQENFTPKKNEVNLNLPIAIFASFPEISYERIVAEDMGVGASVAWALDNDFLEMKFMFTPYVRWYFSGSMESTQKYASGFFVEANGSVFTKDEEEDKNGLGLGIAVGWKFVTRGNWTGQFFAGGGRNFAKGGGAFPRLGITIGKRF